MSQCCVDNCNNKHKTKGYCSKHYQQLVKHGKILKRTNYDKNIFVLSGDKCFITIYTRDNKTKCIAVIDAQDYKLVKGFKWYFDTYVRTKKENKTQNLSSVVLGRKSNKSFVVDHINGDVLDNRKENLRVCTNKENFWNQGLRSNNTSGYKGVFFDKDLKKWRARIKVNYKGIHLGVFKDKKEAAKAYNKAATKYFGEFARLNSI